MKKQYINPEMEVVELKMQHNLLTVSNPAIDPSQPPVNPGTGADAPRFDWDDDWEDE